MIAQSSAAAGTVMLGRAFAQQREQVIPWIDQPADVPPGPIQLPQTLRPGFSWTVATGPIEPGKIVHNLQKWEDMTSWITPNDRFFQITHYGTPVIDPRTYALEVTGLVDNPLKLSLEQLKALPREKVVATIECSGNRGLPFLTSAIGNAEWGGTSLADVLRRAKPRKNGVEIVFVGHDMGDEVVRDVTVRANFGRSMTLDDAMNSNSILCHEMNGAALPPRNGFPLRLIVPGWYGIASVKWLKRIEVRDARYMGRFMARDYVTLREEKIGGETFWSETSVGRARLSSAVARVARDGDRYRVMGMAWGAPLGRVEVQIDGGPWRPAALDGRKADNAWRFWSVDWPNATAGEHAIVSRAFDAKGNVQPTADDPLLVGKKTYWESNGQAVRHIRI
jgi:DMSO/TMAO reductase YedYZ molybdopterin-dependent catalytic subunit